MGRIFSFHDLAAAQYGLITKEQALECFSRREFERRVRTGQLVCVRRRVYRCEGVASSYRQKLLAVCLSLGPPVAASHRAAARLWELEGFEKARLEVTVTPGRNGGIGRGRDAEVVLHWANLTPADSTSVFGIPTTTAIRTILDLAAVVGDGVLEKALDDALRRKLFTIQHMTARLSTTRAGGHRRLAGLRRLVDARGFDYQPGETVGEDQIYNWIVDAGLPPPKRQHWLTLNGKPRRIDLSYPELKIAIEFDGWEHHQTRRKFDDDRARAGELQLADWLVLQFTSRSTPLEVVGRVAQARGVKVQRGARQSGRSTE